MTKHKVEITQHYTVIRTIIVEIEADDVGQAVECAEQAPAVKWSDERWNETWDLRYEEANPKS